MTEKIRAPKRSGKPTAKRSLIIGIIQRLREKNIPVNARNIVDMANNPEVNPAGIKFSKELVWFLKKNSELTARHPEFAEIMRATRDIKNPVLRAVLALAFENERAAGENRPATPINTKTVYALADKFVPGISKKYVDDTLTALRRSGIPLEKLKRGARNLKLTSPITYAVIALAVAGREINPRTVAEILNLPDTTIAGGKKYSVQMVRSYLARMRKNGIMDIAPLKRGRHPRPR